ncbi:MAG: amidohydrolase family protein [Spirochaetaceae bacterium]|nr:amidohydrolase family protein [Spirochaetaceae bacterium]
MNDKFDHHVHIGQWKNEYYSAPEVFSHLKHQGKIGCNFMSTTSCAPLHPDDKKEIISLYEKVCAEINEALYTAKQMNFDVHAYYWIVPLFHISGISFEQVLSELPEYCGLKIHPRSHNWSPQNPERAELLHQVFCFAKKYNLPVILHTGDSAEDSPCLYEEWYKNYPAVKVTLAHCKNLSEVVYLFDKFPQLNGDTAFIPQNNFEYLLQNGYENRLVYGSDYPISTFYRITK